MAILMSNGQVRTVEVLRITVIVFMKPHSKIADQKSSGMNRTKHLDKVPFLYVASKPRYNKLACQASFFGNIK